VRIEHENDFDQASRLAGNSLSAGSEKCDAFELFSILKPDPEAIATTSIEL
jgi:hypothetical protein